MQESLKENSEQQKWRHPSEVMKLHKWKLKKRALQARISGNGISKRAPTSESLSDISISTFSDRKRKNPFIIENDEKRRKSEFTCEESTDQTLFKLLNASQSLYTPTSTSSLSFKNILSKIDDPEPIQIVKVHGEKWLPIDWSLNNKIRLLSNHPFPWNQKLKVNEEASGITGFTRCLDSSSDTNIDTSPNSKFHQCCLVWQQPSLPWMSLFPRCTGKTSLGNSICTNLEIKTSLQSAWFDGLKSLFQLVRTRQCPYFYACANNFTVLFRAAGVCGHSDIHVLVSPTTRGFRKLLKQEDIEFTMPLKKKRTSDQGYDTLDSTTLSMSESNDLKKQTEEKVEEEDEADDEWMKSMGLNENDIKQINYTQAKIEQKEECFMDNLEESLVLVEGVEVHGFYNFLLNCKSAIAVTGPLAGVPPTLIAPVAFNGATLTGLKMRENKVNVDNINYYSIELMGPILPTTIHNIFTLTPPEHDMTATFFHLPHTASFSKSKRESRDEKQGEMVFGKENLSDCGLNPKILKYFCQVKTDLITNVECVKYISADKTFTWT